jgi:hypothetical protein
MVASGGGLKETDMNSKTTTIRSQQAGALHDRELDHVVGGLEVGARALGELIYKLISGGSSSSDNSSYGMCYDR